MTIDDKIRDEKLQHDINRETAKISALSSRKIDKHEYLTGEEVLSSDQRGKIEQAYIFSSWENFRKTNKSNRRSRAKVKNGT